MRTRIYFHNNSREVEKCIVMNFSSYDEEAEPGGWKRKQINVTSKHRRPNDNEIWQIR